MENIQPSVQDPMQAQPKHTIKSISKIKPQKWLNQSPDMNVIEMLGEELKNDGPA